MRFGGMRDLRQPHHSVAFPTGRSTRNGDFAPPRKHLTGGQVVFEDLEPSSWAQTIASATAISYANELITAGHSLFLVSRADRI